MRLYEQFSEAEIELLKLRAERVAAPVREADSAGKIFALTATMGSERYALPIDAISAVYQHVAITPLPCVPRYVAGITNVRGRVISVLDLAVILGAEGADVNQTALIVTEAEGASIGLRIENLGDVVELSMADLNPVSDHMGLLYPEYFLGIFPDGIALLDVAAIVNDPRLNVDDPVS
jgi:purine-binding chemotaxis protein CheW